MNYDLESFANEVALEKKKVYLCHRGDNLLVNAPNSTTINTSGLKYLNKGQYDAQVKQKEDTCPI